MRIVSGKHRGRVLYSPENNLIRPTSDKVRLALFNALNSRQAVADAVVLDGFCGTGALALEALSQGAQSAILIDEDKVSLVLARKNAVLLKEETNCIFLHQDVTKIAQRQSGSLAATLCFLDPPYRKGLIETALSVLKEKNWLAPGAWIVAEMERDLASPLSGMEKIYGETKIVMGQI